MAIVAGATLFLSILVIGYYVSGAFKGKARPLDTPEWRTANELSEKLIVAKFPNVGVSVDDTQDPPKFVVRGGVNVAGDLDKLKAKLNEFSPGTEFIYEVEVLKK
jgi:hypothetical protein